MSPAAKYNTKWLLTVIGTTVAVLVTVITSTASITTRFNQNDADHLAITSSLQVEVKANADETARSKADDKAMSDAINKIDKTQTEIRKDVEYIRQSIDEIHDTI